MMTQSWTSPSASRQQGLAAARPRSKRSALLQVIKKVFISIAFMIPALVTANTQIAEEDFEVELPGEWHKLNESEEGEGLYVYADSANQQRLTVSVLYFTGDTSQRQRRDVIDQFVEARRQSTSSVQPGTDLGAVELREFPSAHIATYEERGPDQHRATNKTICTSVGVFNFYYEAFLQQTEYEQNSTQLMSSTAVAT